MYLTMGQYDSVAILALRERFGTGTQTLQAFPESQWPELAKEI